MNIQKLSLDTSAVMPLMAALPYALASGVDTGSAFHYDAEKQVARFSHGRNFSTCREDESVNPFFGKSKSDTQKDD